MSLVPPDLLAELAQRMALEAALSQGPRFIALTIMTLKLWLGVQKLLRDEDLRSGRVQLEHCSVGVVTFIPHLSAIDADIAEAHLEICLNVLPHLLKVPKFRRRCGIAFEHGVRVSAERSDFLKMLLIVKISIH